LGSGYGQGQHLLCLGHAAHLARVRVRVGVRVGVGVGVRVGVRVMVRVSTHCAMQRGWR
jgi:hypothetical protein